MSISLLSGFPRRYLESGVLLEKKKRGSSMSRDEHIPASDGTDTTGLHGVEMTHDCGMYGFDFFARYAVLCVSTKVLARVLARDPHVRTRSLRNPSAIRMSISLLSLFSASVEPVSTS